LFQLINALGFIRPVDLVGVSMGGAIAATFTDRHPDRVRRLALIAPAGLLVKPSLSAMALFTPGLGDLLMALAGDKIVVGGLPNDFLHPRAYPEYYEGYQAQMPYKGFKRALLSTMRSMPLTRMADVFARVGQQDREVLLLWGREDATIPATTAERVKAAIPQADVHVIDAAGHNVEYERPEAVNPLLIDFLRG